MNEEDFMSFVNLLTEYLEKQKVFVQNPRRMADVNAATEMACRLFPEANITLEDDPLQMGAVILCIEDFDITVRETVRFSELTSKANNFEIFPVGDEKVKLSMVFNNALIMI